MTSSLYEHGITEKSLFALQLESKYFSGEIAEEEIVE